MLQNLCFTNNVGTFRWYGTVSTYRISFIPMYLKTAILFNTFDLGILKIGTDRMLIMTPISINVVNGRVTSFVQEFGTLMWTLNGTWSGTASP